MADWGLKVSRAGYSVHTSTGDNTLFVNNDTLLKVAQSGSGSFSSNPITITHSLGYIPQFLVFITNTSGKTYLATGEMYQAFAYSSTTQLTFGNLSANASTYQYYIFYNKADASTYSTTSSAADYGIKIMNDGESITSTDIGKQSLNSEKNCLKISTSGTYTYTGSAGTTYSIAHGLSYVPGAIIWFEVGGNGKWYSSNSWEFIGSHQLYTVTCNTDSTYINLIIGSSSGSITVKIFYQLFVEKAV